MNSLVQILLASSLCIAVLSTPVPQGGQSYTLPAPSQPLRPGPPPSPPQPSQLYDRPDNQQSGAAIQGQAVLPPAEGMEGMPYEFEWTVEDADSANQYKHFERSDGNIYEGEYRVMLPDGRLQIVTFADRGNGFEAQVTYE